MLSFANRLAPRNKPVWVRFVLVPALTDNFDDIGHIADLAAGLGVIDRVDVAFSPDGRFQMEGTWAEV